MIKFIKRSFRLKSMDFQKKNTKIVATISDLRCDVEFIQELYSKGMNVVRMNTAHQDIDGTIKVIENVRKVSNKIAILIDTKGPEIRTVVQEPISVKKGDFVYIGKDFTVNYDKFITEVPNGTIILINDGEIELEVVEKTDTLKCLVKNDAEIKNKKTVNVPKVSLNLPSVTPKDVTFIELAVKHNLDFIAHSFVRHKEDVLAVQNILDQHKSNIKIIAKIENQEGVDNIEEILDHCYGIMVARGDLGVEIPAAQIPLIQKNLVKAALKKAKPVIVATQMLESMINNPRATRAEISDVANAILDGAGAIMLSGETAYGKYPSAAVQTMAEVSLDLQNGKRSTNPAGVEPDISTEPRFLAKAAVDAALQFNVDAIVIPSVTGATARRISSLRSRKPIYAPCYDETTMRHLTLSYGVYVDILEQYKTTDELVSSCVKKLLETNLVTIDSKIVIVSGTPQPMPHRTNFMEIATVKDILAEYQKDS